MFPSDTKAPNFAICAEAFVTIPQRLLLNAGLCHQDPVYGHAFSQLKKEAGAEIDSRHLLCLLLIVERAKGEASLWHPYIQYLPETYGAPLKIVYPKDSASDPCSTKLIFGSQVLKQIKYILQCPSELGFGICTSSVDSLSPWQTACVRLQMILCGGVKKRWRCLAALAWRLQSSSTVRLLPS